VPIIRRIIVSVRHLVYVTLCRCPSGMQASGELLYQCDTWFMSLCVDDRLVCIPCMFISILYTFWAATCWYAYQTVIYTEWYKPGVALIQKFSWWWARGCPKYVENRNKHTQKIVHQVGYLQRMCQGNIIPKCKHLATEVYRGVTWASFISELNDE